MKYVPLISIVTPSFNQKSFIGEALESVQLQNHEYYEHLVIDGVSTDGTVDLLRGRAANKRYRKMSWISEEDSGQSEALNKGFRRAKGEIIGWLNSDDRYRPGCFEHVIQAFKNHPETDIFYGDYRVVNETGRLLQIRQQRQHFSGAGYSKKATGSTRSFNTRWIRSFSFVLRNVVTALSTFRTFFPILGCSLRARPVS
jgi:glycosyltransferase involved in cell wall biosynthesis